MSTHTDALAQVYARSLYDLAEDAGGRDKILEIAEELEQILELTRQDSQFGEFIASPIIDTGQRANALRAIFSDRVTDLTLRFLLVLNAKQRLSHLSMIVAAYDHLVQEAFGRVEVDVFTPAPLGEEQVEVVRQRIQAALGKEPVVHAYTDPTMLGGLKLRIGDQLIDGSVAGRLRRMRGDILSTGSLRDRMSDILEDTP